jgi:hypothetical protein
VAKKRDEWISRGMGGLAKKKDEMISRVMGG